MRAALQISLLTISLHSIEGTASTSISSLSELPFDENGHLSKHVLAVPSGHCIGLVEAEIRAGVPLYHHAYIEVRGEAADALFDHGYDSDDIADIKQCQLVCLDRGVDASVVGFPIPENYFQPKENNDHYSFANFMGSLSCGRCEFGFINYTPHEKLKVYWVDHQGEKIYIYDLGRLEKNTKFTHTFIGHRFIAEDPDGNEVMDHVVQSYGVIGIGEWINQHLKRDIRREVEATMGGEWAKHLHVKRTFSPLGFDKGRLPNDVFGSIGSYYYNNRKSPHKLLEEWGSKGLYVNYWESDCEFIQIPWSLKQIWQERLRLMVQEWAGVDIEQTDMYGIRQYTEGARLLTHVDRITTHAVSLIVNIAQSGNLTQPWTVEVYDHADRLHEVVMEPGDIVYYESAKSLHGRNTPLTGGTYANVFTHYRPTGDPNWYKKENPEGTPEPLMDVGKCELAGKSNEYSQGAAICENSAIGLHLSPKMITAQGGKDLYDFWLNVGPPDGIKRYDEL